MGSALFFSLNGPCAHIPIEGILPVCKNRLQRHTAREEGLLKVASKRNLFQSRSGNILTNNEE